MVKCVMLSPIMFVFGRSVVYCENFISQRIKITERRIHADTLDDAYKYSI